MKLTHTLSISSSMLLATLAVACGATPEGEGDSTVKSATAWSCQSAEIPMGEVVRCTQGALIIDESAGSLEACSGASDNPEICPPPYECTAGEPGCPDADAGGGTGGTSGTSPPPSTDGSDNGASSPEECSYVDDLPYCRSSDGTSSGGSDCVKGKCTAPGKQKAQSSDASSPPDGGSSSSGRTKGPRKYTCKKDNKGNRACESEPECAARTHPSACGACVEDGDSSDCVPQSAGGCWVTGGGFIVAENALTGAAADGHDNFGGNAKPMKDGRVQGHWNHVDHGTGNHAKGRPEYIVCRRVDEPGPGQPGGKKGFTMNQVYFGGPAEWRSNDTWASGYWFDVVAKDHGEPGSVPHVKNGRMPDTYHFTIRKMDDPTNKVSGAVVYETKGVLEGGNIQMHPPNAGHPYTPSALPGWVSFEP